MNIKRIAVTAALTALAATAYVIACGPFVTMLGTVQRIRPAHPDEYARGNVGVVRPRFARRYLVQAYRRFTGQPPLANLVASSVKPDYSTPPPPRPLDGWMAFRAPIVSDLPDPKERAPFIAVSRRAGDYQYVLNCLDDAFVAAVRTGTARAATFGASSPALRAWVKAQDAVFANCGGEGVILPDPAPADADALTRADRAYQTAAAHFYAMQFDEAATAFRTIAGDAASPWRPYGHYLAARALIRTGTIPEKLGLGPLGQAEAELRRTLEDPAAANLHGSARGLLAFIMGHTRPLEGLRAISPALATGRSVTEQQITDFQWLMDRLVGDTTEYDYANTRDHDTIAQSSSMTDWILAMQGSGDAARDRAIAQWKSTAAPVWLVAALWQVRPGHADAGALLKAASTIDRSSPAFATVAFLRVRLLAHEGKVDEARRVLAGLPDAPQPGFEAETINLLAAERMMLAATLDDLLRYAPRIVVTEQDVDTVYPATNPEPIFADDAEALLSQRLPLSRLVEAAASSRLPPRLRQRVASATLVRALLLERHEDALALVPVLGAGSPALRGDLDRFQRAASPEDRHIAGVALLLRTPGLHLAVTDAEDATSVRVRQPARTFDHVFRDNWWCGFGPNDRESRQPEGGVIELVYPPGRVPSPSFLSDAERSAFETEKTALAAVGRAPTYLAREAVKWAVARPADPDAAEALAHAVEGTRWGCGDDKTSAASRAAFQTLHRLFPKSEWALKTKYWY